VALHHERVGVGVEFGERHVGSGLAIGACAKYLDLLFDRLPIEKVYLDVSDLSRPGLDPGRWAARGFVTEEVVLREHRFHDGRYVDEHIYSMSRTWWQDLAPGLGLEPHERRAEPERSTDG
jgi:RimJ/RimL family protein N-acetyltransferase